MASTEQEPAPSAAAQPERFSATFWIANTLELFERLAFYGMAAVLAVYLSDKVGLGTRGSTLAGIFSSVLYAMPVLAGPLVDRFGFRRSLLTCFAMFSAGYFAIGLAGLPAGQGVLQALGTEPYVVAALLFTAVGGSLIKPCIVGTVAYTTRPDARALGYSIYYTLVNLGGAVGPLLATLVRTRLGIEYVLLCASLTSAGLFGGTLIFFREPRAASGEDIPRKTLGQVLRDLRTVFRNGRFLLFLFIFSGFWVMFWQIFLALPFYVKDVLRYEHFEVLEAVDAGAIILLQVPVTALTRRLPPILTMAAGFAVASFSWLIIPQSSATGIVAVALVVFAVGETLQAPRYYEYVAGLAPAGQAGTYMGFAFLPVAIGSAIGGPLASYLRAHYLTGQNPAAMWPAIATVGFSSTLLLVLYDRLLHRRQPA